MNVQNRKTMRYSERYSKRSIRREINKIRDKPQEMEKICQGKFANYQSVSIEINLFFTWAFAISNSDNEDNTQV